MKTTEFKSLIKSIFPNDKISFKQDIAGTAFESDGTIIIKAIIKKEWDYILPVDIENKFISAKINMSSVNNELRFTHHSFDKVN